jgi:hypothetical protein
LIDARRQRSRANEYIQGVTRTSVLNLNNLYRVNRRVVFLVPPRSRLLRVALYRCDTFNIANKRVGRRNKNCRLSSESLTMADPNTHTTPSATPVPSCKDTSCTPRHLCVCNWDDCADFQRLIRELADPSHRWNSGLIQIRNSLDSLKILALRASIVHHLRPTKEDQSKDSFFVAAHHWSLSLWQEMTGRPCLATPLTARQAKKYDEHEGYRRHQEDANKLSTMIRRCAPQSNVESGYKPIPSKYEFVKAPVTSKADVLSFVTSLESARSARTEKRQEILHSLSYANIPKNCGYDSC